MLSVGNVANQNIGQILSAFMRPDQLGAGMPMIPPQCPCQAGDRFNGSGDLGNGNAMGSIPNIGGMMGGPGASPTGAAQGPAPAGGVEPAGSGGGGAAARAVDLAQKYEGQPSKSLKGKLPGFNAPGGNTNNCAAFVSACLEHTGALPKGGGSASVSALRGKLKKAGWKKVPANQAQKGAVWMTKEGQGSHTELVASTGGSKTIGSNNVKKGFQVVKERPKNPSSGEFYAPPNG